MKRAARPCLFVWLVVGALGCQPVIPEGVYVCSFDGECPPEMTCEQGRCVRGCVPAECELPRCGVIDDGCGGTVDCGDTCPGDDTCGGGDYPGLCGCTPRAECSEAECGAVDNGCGASLDCGGCPGGEDCDELTNRCVACVEEGCAPDECGERLSACGGDPIVCPVDCADFGEVCGPDNRCVSDCTPGPPQCGDRECGQFMDGCSGVEVCGEGCTDQERCGMEGEEDGVCVCLRSCPPQYECGSRPLLGCGPVECGPPCPPNGGECVGNQCVCPPDPYDAEGSNDTWQTASEWAPGAPNVAGIASDDDHDWYRVAADGTMPFEGRLIMEVTLDGSPGSPDDYDLVVFVASDTLECLDGQLVSGGPDDSSGCLSHGSGVTERVEIRVDRAPSSVWIHVAPIEASDCSPYALQMAFQAIAPPAGGG